MGLGFTGLKLMQLCVRWGGNVGSKKKELKRETYSGFLPARASKESQSLSFIRFKVNPPRRPVCFLEVT